MGVHKATSNREARNMLLKMEGGSNMIPGHVGDPNQGDFTSLRQTPKRMPSGLAQHEWKTA